MSPNYATEIASGAWLLFGAAGCGRVLLLCSLFADLGRRVCVEEGGRGVLVSHALLRKERVLVSHALPWVCCVSRTARVTGRRILLRFLTAGTRGVSQYTPLHTSLQAPIWAWS